MIKLPNEEELDPGEVLPPLRRHDFMNGVRFTLAEVQRLNATAQPVSDGWVKCSERMPKFGTSVLVWDEGVITGESTGSTTSFGLGIFWVSDQKEDSGSVKCYATHWMPLPAAPGGQDD